MFVETFLPNDNPIVLYAIEIYNKLDFDEYNSKDRIFGDDDDNDDW